MTTTTTCDHCHQPIEDENDRLRVEVNDIWLPTFEHIKRAPFEDGKRKRRQVVEKPPTRNVRLDLHRHCYEEALLPSIERIGR